jgi:hypothetical protein
MTQLGKIYIAPGGMQLIVTKGGAGVLSDGTTPLLRADRARSSPTARRQAPPRCSLGKRYKSADGAVEVLINKPGPCDLRYEGQPMELKDAKPLPSSD